MRRPRLLLGVAAILLALGWKAMLPAAHGDCASGTRSHECPTCLSLTATTAILPVAAPVPPPESSGERVSRRFPTPVPLLEPHPKCPRGPPSH